MDDQYLLIDESFGAREAAAEAMVNAELSSSALMRR